MTAARTADIHAPPCADLRQTREHVAALDERTQATKERLDSMSTTLRAVLTVAAGSLFSTIVTLGVLIFGHILK